MQLKNKQKKTFTFCRKKNNETSVVKVKKCYLRKIKGNKETKEQNWPNFQKTAKNKKRHYNQINGYTKI